MQQLIAVDADALKELLDRVARVENLLSGSQVSRREDWISIPDAARVLKCDPSTIRRKINSGELQAKGSGKSRRVKLD